MSLAERLVDYVRACFTGIWVESHEHEDALSEIAGLCQCEDWKLMTWDIHLGLSEASEQSTDLPADPLTAIRSINAMATIDGSALLVLRNFHRLIQSPEIVQALAHQIHTGKNNRTFIIILAPVVTIPVELEKLFVVLEHELPNREQLEEIAMGIATEEGEMPTEKDRGQLLDAAGGLTRYEAEAAFSLSLVREGRLTASTLWEQKAQMLKKSGLLQLHRGGEDFQSLGGLASLKSFCKQSLTRPTTIHSNNLARGVLLLGVPGTGKSAFAKALGTETGRPTLMLDIGALLGSLVGQTEQNIRQALQIADAMAPCILFIDELEKALAGSANSTQSDSGVSSRLFGTMLTWMNDHTSDVYLIATCNDISKLPPEFSRAERFDAVVFLDLPGRDEKDLIWEMYCRQYKLEPDQRRPKDDFYTGAEIKACCRLAALLGLSLTQAAQNVVPVAVTASESVEKLRHWASGRCLSAHQPGVFQYHGAVPNGRRRASSHPSNN